MLDEQPRWPLLNRLVFANFISTFEVFLADTLIGRALSTPEVLSQLIAKDKNLRDRRFSLTEIAAAPDLIKDTVRNRLRSEMWHNLPRASALYKIAFGIDILKLFGEDTATIMRAIEYRHDCVHRNGRDKDGNELDVFNQEYINGIARILARVAEAIENELSEQDAKRMFGDPLLTFR